MKMAEVCPMLSGVQGILEILSTIILCLGYHSRNIHTIVFCIRKYVVTNLDFEKSKGLAQLPCNTSTLCVFD